MCNHKFSRLLAKNGDEIKEVPLEVCSDCGMLKVGTKTIKVMPNEIVMSYGAKVDGTDISASVGPGFIGVTNRLVINERLFFNGKRFTNPQQTFVSSVSCSYLYKTIYYTTKRFLMRTPWGTP